jgi:ribosomal protein S18 acetylase RimI-like enzyme
VIPVTLPDSCTVDARAHLERLATGPFRGVALRAPADDRGWVDAARETGWEDAGVRERWRGPLTARPLDTDVRSWRDVGRPAFTTALEACLDGADPRFAAGAAALLEDWEPIEPVDEGLFGVLPGIGVVVPRIVEPEVGSLLFVGVRPEVRGQGHGRRLHDAALALLFDAGARAYEDETGADNPAMKALFARAGLACIARWRTLRRSAPC